MLEQWGMIPLTPKSVKMTPDLYARIREDAQRLGYSDNQFIVDAVQCILDLVEEEEKATIPKLVELIWTARKHEGQPISLNKNFKESANKVRRPASSKTRRKKPSG